MFVCLYQRVAVVVNDALVVFETYFHAIFGGHTYGYEIMF